MYQPSLFNKNALIGSAAYLEALNYLDGTLKYGIKPGHERINALLKELSNPHRRFETILVTGTNGKTSTARMIATLLASHGYKTGLYTSPHLHSYCERIEINGAKISEEELAKALNDIKPAIKKADKATGDPLTNFEILTALAFYYYAQEEVKCAVLEVGMGARFDATCLTKAKVSVITNVELDHTDYLGNSIEEIAKEKAFAIKEGSKVVLGALRPQAQRVVEKRAAEMSADIKNIDRDFSLRSAESGLDNTQKINVDGLFFDYKNIKLPAAGRHQAINAAIAIVAAELFNERLLMVKKFKVPLSNLSFDGRMEIMQTYPAVIVDGAHNPAAARNLGRVLREEFEYDKLILVLAIYKDKDYKAIATELLPLANNVIFSENSSQRCLKADKLARLTNKSNYQVIKPLAAAIDVAKGIAAPGDLICITGSLATAADARMILSDERLNGSAE